MRFRTNRYILCAVVLCSIIIIVEVQHRCSHTESEPSNLEQSGTHQENPNLVPKVAKKLDDSGAFHYLKEMAKLLNTSRDPLRGVDPNIPGTIREWWQAAAMIDWYYHAPPRYHCRNKASYGNWYACQDMEVRVKPPCLVYSFGIDFDFSFDDAMAAIGCEVHSFDPSMFKPDHKRSENVTFYNLGVSDRDSDQFEARRDNYVKSRQIWKIRTMSSIKKMLRHEGRVIDVLKIDIEGYEWAVVEQMIDSGIFSEIRQFMLEFHLKVNYPPKEDYIRSYDIYRRLREETNLKKFSTREVKRQLAYHGFRLQQDVGFVNSDHIRTGLK